MADEARLLAGFGGHFGLTLEAVIGDVVRGRSALRQTSIRIMSATREN